LRSTSAGSCPSRQVGEHQVHAPQNNPHDDKQANERVKISCDLHANQNTYKKAYESKDNLTLRHRNLSSPILMPVIVQRRTRCQPVRQLLKHTLFNQEKQVF